MNSVQLIGRLTKDVEVRYTQGQTAVAKFSVAVDRLTKEKQTDFIPVTVFGRQAETCGQYIGKGSKVAVEGRIQTGKYNDKDGRTVYTTDVIANRVEFLDSRKEHISDEQIGAQFEMVSDPVPF